MLIRFCVALVAMAAAGGFASNSFANTSGPAFPLKVSANRRYLVDQQNQPFFVLGDTPWFIQKQTIEDVRVLMDDRLAKGFNTLFHWREILSARSTIEAPNILKLFAKLSWWKLAPDAQHRFVTAGFGEWKQADYVTAVLAEDGSCAVVYLPRTQTITVDLTQLRAPATARWFDPTANVIKPIESLPLANTGSREFTPPGLNSTRDADWVLVLQTNE